MRFMRFGLLGALGLGAFVDMFGLPKALQFRL